MVTKEQLLMTLTMLLIAVPAFADNGERWYATANLGLGTLGGSTLTYTDGTTTTTAEADFEASFVGGGTLGYRFDNGWNLEGEITYRRNELDPINVAGLGNFTEGDFASLSFGLNALYRFNLGDSGKLSGYVGPGIVYLQEIDIDFDANGQQEISFESDDTALQLKFGGRYDFNDRWFADFGATYFIADSITMELPSDTSQTIESDYDHWSIQLGAGFRF